MVDFVAAGNGPLLKACSAIYVNIPGKQSPSFTTMVLDPEFNL